jgi:hypothetical protein
VYGPAACEREWGGVSSRRHYIVAAARNGRLVRAPEDQAMDIVYVGLILALFGLMGLMALGVDRL